MGLVLRSTKRTAFEGAIVVVVEDTAPATATADSSRGDFVEREAALLFNPTATRGFVVVIARTLSVVVVDRGVSNDNAALAVLFMLLRPGRIDGLLFRPPPPDTDTAGTVNWGGEAGGAGEAGGCADALRSNGGVADVRSGLGTFVESSGTTLVVEAVEAERFFSSSVAFVAE